MSDHDQPVADNLLKQAFTAERPNQRWVGDTSEFVIGESGKLYLAVIVDVFSRFVVGWAVSACNDRHVTIKALEMALKRRCPDVGLLHHSDQGCTYASEDYQRILTSRGIICSMSRRGNCYDNAVMRHTFGPFTPLIHATEIFETALMADHGKAAQIQPELRTKTKRWFPPRLLEQMRTSMADQHQSCPRFCPAWSENEIVCPANTCFRNIDGRHPSR